MAGGKSGCSVDAGKQVGGELGRLESFRGGLSGGGIGAVQHARYPYFHRGERRECGSPAATDNSHGPP